MVVLVRRCVLLVCVGLGVAVVAGRAHPGSLSFDEVIRTYLFRLEVDASKFPQHPALGAYFVGADGRELKATIEIRQ